MGIFSVGLESRGKTMVLTGQVDRAEARAEALQAVSNAGINATDEITVLPTADLGPKTFTIGTLSVANGREFPDHKAEMGTQILMGHSARILKSSRFWFLVQSSDGYLSWVEKGAVLQCTKENVEAWNEATRLIVTAFDDCVRESPQADAQPVSDVVIGDLLKVSGDENGWFKVELPDGRKGFLPTKSATNYSDWKKTRVANADNIERTAKMFLGRPYLWGGNSPKGFDCSGFAKTVFLLNGIQLNRNASEQAWQGAEVSVDSNFKNLKKGDLLFFGWSGRRGREGRVPRVPNSEGPEIDLSSESATPRLPNGPMITHVAIYLGDKLFIQSSQRVKISSFDPESPLFDEHHSRSLLFARRLLPETTAAQAQP
jgi:cell wall-associated NlpC family hydrolase